MTVNIKLKNDKPMADSTDTSAESCGHRQSHQFSCLIGCFRQLVGPANLLIVILGVKAAQSRGLGRGVCVQQLPPEAFALALASFAGASKLQAASGMQQAAGS